METIAIQHEMGPCNGREEGTGERYDGVVLWIFLEGIYLFFSLKVVIVHTKDTRRYNLD